MMFIHGLIVPCTGKAVGGTRSVLFPTSMVCTLEQIRLAIVELSGMGGTTGV